LGCLNFSHSAHKADKCKCSLCRHNAVAAALEALGAAIVHPVGQPINHSVKAGFKRRGEVGPVLDDAWPGGVGWAWGEEWATKLLNWSMCLRPPPVIVQCSTLFSPFASLAAGVGHIIKPASFAVGAAVPAKVFGEFIAAEFAFHAAACSRMFGPIFPLL
jgi:hypothetical protein